VEIKGQWWPYSDHPYNTSGCQDFQDGFTVDNDAGIIKFDYPVFALSGGCPIAATIYALVGHRFRKANGEFDRKEFDSAVGGTGEAVEILVPELFYAVRQGYVAGACTSAAATTTNITPLTNEANAVLACWNTALSEDYPVRKRRAIGIRQVDCSGLISGVYFEAGLGSPGWTDIYYGSRQRPLDKLTKYQSSDAKVYCKDLSYVRERGWR